jgi:hypothetical protein
MNNACDKDVIKHWLQLYNRLTGSSFHVEDWPDRDSSKKNIDAICRDSAGRTLAIEHTLIEPFEGEKADAIRFLKTLATLENHPSLLQAGYRFTVSQPVNSIPTGPKWDDISRELLSQLQGVLSRVPEGSSKVVIRADDWSLELQVDKEHIDPDEPGTFLTARVYPGDPGPELMLRALEKKVGKLAASAGDTKILLLEKDAAAGRVERQLEQVLDEPEIKSLLAGIDQIWSVNTVALATDNYIFTNQVVPPIDNANCCSLNLQTGRFWRRQGAG